MAKFKFRLQTYLNLKIQLEKDARNELGLATIKLQQEKEKLKNIVDCIDLYTDKFRKACTGQIQPAKINEIKTYLEHLDHRKQIQLLNVKKAQENVDKKREKLIEIMKEKKVLEKLREHKFEEYKKEEERSEQQRVDELVSYKGAAKNIENRQD
ncbi:MAG: flagellar export protein FliJ [Clostridiaceae bacterium]|nr:flagellar export protein FliJ [Clostridiaceae bacterium]